MKLYAILGIYLTGVAMVFGAFCYGERDERPTFTDRLVELGVSLIWPILLARFLYILFMSRDR